MDHSLELEPVATHTGAESRTDCGVVELTAAELDAVGGGGIGFGGTGPAGRSSQFGLDANIAGGGGGGTGSGIA